MRRHAQLTTRWLLHASSKNLVMLPGREDFRCLFYTSLIFRIYQRSIPKTPNFQGFGVPDSSGPYGTEFCMRRDHRPHAANKPWNIYKGVLSREFSHFIRPHSWDNVHSIIERASFKKLAQLFYEDMELLQLEISANDQRLGWGGLYFTNKIRTPPPPGRGSFAWKPYIWSKQVRNFY